MTARCRTGYVWTNGARFFDRGGSLVMDKGPNLERITETLDFWKEASKYGPPGITQFTWLEVMQSYQERAGPSGVSKAAERLRAAGVA